MSSPQFEFDLDLKPLAEATGVIKGSLNAIESDLYVNYFINYGLDMLRSHFQKEFLLVAVSNPSKYHHVFEWESLNKGVPIPLYRIRKTGQGRSRALSFDFVQSRKSVPLPKGLDLKGHQLRRHIFRFKAIVMETGSPVHIVPKQSKKLLIPDSSNKRGFVFANKATVANPGGSATTGAFSGFWTQWFGGRAETLTQKEIIPRAERNIKRDVELGLRKVRSSGKTGTRSFALIATESKAAMQEQEKMMIANAAKYYQEIGDEDDE